MKHLFHYLCLSVALAACTPASSSDGGSSSSFAEAERPKTAEELRAELVERERNAPSEYLSVEAKEWRNLVDQLVIEGDIANQATLANFKDPVLAVTWYSKTNTELTTQNYPLYELVRAQQTQHFKLKTDAPDYVATIRVGIASATAVE